MSLYLIAGFSGPARTGHARIIYAGEDQAEGLAEAERQKAKFQSFGRLANPMWIPVTVTPVPVAQEQGQEQAKPAPLKSKPTLRT